MNTHTFEVGQAEVVKTRNKKVRGLRGEYCTNPFDTKKKKIIPAAFGLLAQETQSRPKLQFLWV